MNGNTKSYMDSLGDAQAVIDGYHTGLGTVVKTESDRVIIRLNNITGTFVNMFPGKPTIVKKTDLFQIKGRGRGTINVVPLDPTRNF